MSQQAGTSPTIANDGFIRVGTLDEVQQRGCIVVSAEHRPVAVFYNDGNIRAVDNRCPHMGFPLHKGTVQDGILTCHWHHARFDLTSGCTFDLFADDVPTCPVEIRDGVVYVCSDCHYADEGEHWKRRLEEGMAQDIGLIIAKSVIAMLRGGKSHAARASERDIVRQGALFGARFRDGWASGMTILTAMANLAGELPEEEKFLALYQGLTRVADDCEGEEPRRDRHPLESSEATLDTLKRWLRYWIEVRHRDGAERTLLTAIANGATPAQVADLLLTAATDRYYADTGHALDFINKAFEVLELIGWEHAPQILPTVVRQLAAARGGEELNSWRHPIDLVPLLKAAFEEVSGARREVSGNGGGAACAELARDILGDDPVAIVGAVKSAILAGMAPTDLTKSLAYAAAMRIARFGTSNEFPDWITALHTFTYCNALHQMMRRVTSVECRVTRNGAPPDDSSLVTRHASLLRGVFHGAMSVYLDRFLNVPPARLPGERDSFGDEPADADELLAKFLTALDSQQRVDEGARVVARYLSLQHPIPPLVATLTRAVVREDANFHTFQVVEAGVQQYKEWGDTPEGRNVLIAVARYLAAHAPTQRAALQTAEIAMRLHRGDSLYEEESD